MNSFTQILPQSMIHLRRRSVWEAADAGILVWKKCFYLNLIYFAIPFCISAGIIYFIAGKNIWVSIIILWWLKPFFDRSILHIISGKFFDGNSTKKKINLLKGFKETIFKDLIADLTWRRFNPYRGVRMPLIILEKLSVKQYKLRKNALIPSGFNFCFLLSIFGILTEIFLLLGEIIFTMLSLQLLFQSSNYLMFIDTEHVLTFIFIAFCFNYILAESLYVCMGFTLYINCRVEAEGWDLELQFNKLNSIHKKSNQTGINKAKILFLVFSFFIITLTSPVVLQADELTSPSPEQMEMLKEILSSDDFGSIREGWSIRIRPQADLDQEINIDESWIDFIQRILNNFLRAFVILIITVILILIFYWYIKSHPKSKNKKLFPKMLNTVNNSVKHDSKSLFSKALECNEQNKFYEAWTACYLGYLTAYNEYYSLSFPLDSTEYECLNLVKETLPMEEENFRIFIDDWVNIAYGGKIPAGENIVKAVNLGLSIGEKRGDVIEP